MNSYQKEQQIKKNWKKIKDLTIVGYLCSQKCHNCQQCTNYIQSPAYGYN